MQIILLQDVRGLGKRYDVKNVSDGYARNLLFPNKLAEPATPEELKRLEEMKAKLDQDDVELRSQLGEIARKIKETALEFNLKADKSGAIFGSVTKEQILSAMRDARLVGKERVDIELEHPIKKLGEHVVAVDLKKGIRTELRIVIKSE